MSLYKTLSVFKGLALGKPDSVDVSNSTLKLHRFTAVLMLTCSILITCKQYIGENIHCDISGVDEAEGGAKLAESYCFMKATFTIPPKGGKFNQQMAAHLGVIQGEGDDHPDNVFHNYYQWVCFVLFLQAVAFYAPYMVWKWVEKGRLTKLLKKVRSEPLTEKPSLEQVEGISKYLAENSGSYGSYAEKFLFCEAANLVNAVVQIYFTDKFLGGHFFLFGKSYLTEGNSNETNLSSVILETIFPKVTKCTLKLFGQTGKVVNHSGICTLPINILNEKIYLFLWFWFVGLAVLSFIHFIWSLAVRVIKPLRFKLLCNCSPTISQSVLAQINNYTSYGDFILLMHISKNLEPTQFKAVMMGLGDKLGEIYGHVYDSTILPIFLNKPQINKSA